MPGYLSRLSIEPVIITLITNGCNLFAVVKTYDVNIDNISNFVLITGKLY